MYIDFGEPRQVAMLVRPQTGYLHRLPSTGPGRTPSHHPSQKSGLLRIACGKRRRQDSRSAPSCSERLGIDGGSFASWTVEELSLIGQRGGCVKMMRNERMRRRADDVGRCNNMTLCAVEVDE